jgi:hypothetical protein
MDFSLRLLTEDDIPALQAVYDSAAATLSRLLGRPAAPDQAAADFVQGLDDPGRYQFAILLREQVIGLVDCKLDAEITGQAHIGLVLLAEPYDDPTFAALALRILTRWLSRTFDVQQLRVAVPAHVPEQVAFWHDQGFEFTGEQYRRAAAGFAPRLLIMARELPPGEQS